MKPVPITPSTRTTLPVFPLDSVSPWFHMMGSIPPYRNHFFQGGQVAEFPFSDDVQVQLRREVPINVVSRDAFLAGDEDRFLEVGSSRAEHTALRDGEDLRTARSLPSSRQLAAFFNKQGRYRNRG